MADPAAWALLAAALGGIAAGFLSGLMGIGGGLLLVPLLHYGLGLGWAAATTASLASMVLQVPLGLWRHHARGAVDWPLGWRLAAGGAVGVAVGALTLTAVGVVWLKALFAVVLLAGAWRLMRPVAPRSASVGAWAAVGVGALAGAVSRWLGIGGGLLTGPALIATGTPPHRAVATSLVAVWTNAVVAVGLAVVAVGVRADGATILLGGVAGFGALAGAPLGVSAAHRLPAEALRRVVATGLGVGALLLLGRIALGLEAA